MLYKYQWKIRINPYTILNENYTIITKCKCRHSNNNLTCKQYIIIKLSNCTVFLEKLQNIFYYFKIVFNNYYRLTPKYYPKLLLQKASWDFAVKLANDHDHCYGGILIIFFYLHFSLTYKLWTPVLLEHCHDII